MKRILVLFGLLFVLFFISSCDKSTENITVTNIYPSEARVGESVLVIGTGFNNLKRDSAGMIRVFFEGVEV